MVVSTHLKKINQIGSFLLFGGEHEIIFETTYSSIFALAKEAIRIGFVIVMTFYSTWWKVTSVLVVSTSFSKILANCCMKTGRYFS